MASMIEIVLENEKFIAEARRKTFRRRSSVCASETQSEKCTLSMQFKHE